MLRRYFLVFWVLILVIGMMLSGCQSNSVPRDNAQENEATPAASIDLPATVGLGTSPVGGSYNAVGTGLAKVISDNSSIKVIVQPSAGQNAYLPLVDTGELDLAVHSVVSLSWAYAGVNGYEKPHKNLRTLVRGHDAPSMTLVVRADSGIKSIKDLRGKRVAGEYGGAMEIQQMVTAGLESVGLTWNDVRVVPVPDPASAIRALQEGRVDAAFGANPNGAQLLEVDSGIPLNALNFGDLPIEQAGNPPKELIDVLQKRVPGAYLFLQKKVGYLKADTVGIKYAVGLSASSKLSAAAAYEITKTLYENYQELHPIYPMLSMWTQGTMFDPNPTAPYHEGAVRFWKEKGLWTSEAEANQKKLLGQ